MSKRSAGILMHKGTGRELRVLLVHPGGPFWAKKDAGAWSIPKGEYQADEDALTAARREFAEELGSSPPDGGARSLGDVRQAGGKIVICFAVEGDFDAAHLKSNTFECEWPPRSGRKKTFPEVDRAEWFTPAQAREKILVSQSAFIDRLLAVLPPLKE